MNIFEAIKAAQKQGETCIIRSIGITAFRFVQPGNNQYHCLMTEQYGPLQGQGETVSHWSPTLDDLLAINWSVASGKTLIYDAAADTAKEQEAMAPQYNIDDVIEHMCGAVVEGDITGDELASLTGGIKTLVDAKNSQLWYKIKLACAERAKNAQNSGIPEQPKKESDNHGDEQTPEQ